MHSTPSEPLFSITVPQPKAPVKRATVASVSQQRKVTTEQALKGYAYLKSHSNHPLPGKAGAVEPLQPLKNGDGKSLDRFTFLRYKNAR